MKKNRTDLFIDHNTNEIVVIDATGKEVFRKFKTTQTIAIANAIYMSEKYSYKDNTITSF